MHTQDWAHKVEFLIFTSVPHSIRRINDLGSVWSRRYEVNFHQHGSLANDVFLWLDSYDWIAVVQVVLALDSLGFGLQEREKDWCCTYSVRLQETKMQ